MDDTQAGFLEDRVRVLTKERDELAGRIEALQAERDALAAATTGMLDATGAPNFVQTECVNKETGQVVVITIQRKEGKTPGQVATEFRDLNSILNLEIATLKAEAELADAKEVAYQQKIERLKLVLVAHCEVVHGEGPCEVAGA